MGIIVFIIFTALLQGIIKNLESKAQKEISLCSSVQEAAEVRKEFGEKSEKCVFVVLVLCIISILLITFTIKSDLLIDGPLLLLFIIPGCVLDYLLLKKRVNRYIYHPVSTLSIDDIKYPYYALFLRGFDNDDYNPESMLGSGNKKDKKKKKKSKRFSEVQMKNNIETYCCNHTIAVGMPQEVFAPIGCERIYCEPDTWKQDIHHLIDKSLFNIVLLNDRPSCLYELDHCFTSASKTYCIVCEKNIYESLRETYSTFPTSTIPEPFFFRLDNPSMVLKYNPVSFAKRIKEDLLNSHDEKIRQNIHELEKEEKEEKEFKNLKLGCFLVFIVVIIVNIVFAALW